MVLTGTDAPHPPHVRLTLYEEILLLALHDEKGTPTGNTAYLFAMGGAVISELLLAGRIRLVKPRKKHLVEVVAATPVGDALLDECLQEIDRATKRKSVSSWVTRCANTRRLRHRVAEQLTEKGVLHQEQGTVLFVFKRSLYPTADPGPEHALTDRLRRAVVDGEAPDARTLVVVSLAHGTGLLAHVLGKQVVKERKAAITEMIKGDAVGGATKEAVQAAQAAMMAGMVVIPR